MLKTGGRSTPWSSICTALVPCSRPYIAAHRKGKAGLWYENGIVIFPGQRKRSSIFSHECWGFIYCMYLLINKRLGRNMSEARWYNWFGHDDIFYLIRLSEAANRGWWLVVGVAGWKAFIHGDWETTPARGLRMWSTVAWLSLAWVLVSQKWRVTRHLTTTPLRLTIWALSFFD